MTRPNEPCSPCSIISTTAREKLGSASWGIASNRPGARLSDSTSNQSPAKSGGAPLNSAVSTPGVLRVSRTKALGGLQPGVGRAVLGVHLFLPLRRLRFFLFTVGPPQARPRFFEE